VRVRREKGRVRDRGLALLAVLWALLILGMLSMSFAYAMRVEALASRNGFDAVRAYYQARTGINRTLALLAGAPLDNVLSLEIAGEDGDAVYRVEVQDEGGKIDINFAGEEVLKAALRRAGLPEEGAERVGDAILDWRDEDDRPRPGGAEEPEYGSLPEPVRPRNGRFVRLEELLSVKGISPELFRSRLVRIFTVYGASPQVNVNTASPEVLASLPGFSEELAAAVVERRGESLFRSPVEVTAFLAENGASVRSAAFLSVASVSKTCTVVSRGRAGDGVARGIRCVVAAGPGPGAKGSGILHWEDGTPLDEGT
jgi:general secretion pathway protein K